MFTLFRKISHRHFKISKLFLYISTVRLFSCSTVGKMSFKVCWSQVKDVNEMSRPQSRSSHSVSVIGDKLYLLGGEHEARTPIDSQIHCIDLSTVDCASWKIVDVTNGDVPPPRVAHAQCVINSENLYMFGGRQGKCIDEKPMNDFYFFNITNQSWKKVEQYKGEVPCPRSFHAMATIGSSIFIFGGCGPDGQRLNDLHEFKTETKEWIKHEDGPMAGRGGAGLVAAYDNKQLFVLGGFAGEEMEDMYSYNIQDKDWRQILPGLPEPRSVFVSVSVGASHIIFGGELSPSSKGHEGAGNFSADVIVLQQNEEGNLETQKTQLEHDLEFGPSPRGWTSGAALGNNRFAVFGGLTGDDSNPVRLDDIWICKLTKIE